MGFLDSMKVTNAQQEVERLEGCICGLKKQLINAQNSVVKRREELSRDRNNASCQSNLIGAQNWVASIKRSIVDNQYRLERAKAELRDAKESQKQNDLEKRKKQREQYEYQSQVVNTEPQKTKKGGCCLLSLIKLPFVIIFRVLKILVGR